MQPWSLTGERHRRGKDGLFGSCVGIIARLFGAARFPFTPRTRLCGDIATTAKPRSHGWLAFGVFYSGHDEYDICTVGETWHELLRQLKRAEMVRHERHVPSQRILSRTHLHDARIVEEAGDRKIKRD